MGLLLRGKILKGILSEYNYSTVGRSSAVLRNYRQGIEQVPILMFKSE